MMQTNQFFHVTSVSLLQKQITINKNKYHFGNRELGAGAFGKVYPARRVTDGMNFAVKVMSLAVNSSELPSLIESFLNEIRLSMKLSSESKHVVKMFDFDFNRSGLAFIVMELGNEDLEKRLLHRSTISIEQQKILWRQILNILLTLHRHSIVHLDLKPSNLVFFGNRLKLVDLGISQKHNTKRQGPNGTYGFSAPEIYHISNESKSHCTSKADIWSVGAILYWINYGDSPKYDPYNDCYHPPKGLPSVQNSDLIDIFRHTLRYDYRRRPDTNWLTQHSFTRFN